MGERKNDRVRRISSLEQGLEVDLSCNSKEAIVEAKPFNHQFYSHLTETKSTHTYRKIGSCHGRIVGQSYRYTMGGWLGFGITDDNRGWGTMGRTRNTRIRVPTVEQTKNTPTRISKQAYLNLESSASPQRERCHQVEVEAFALPIARYVFLSSPHPRCIISPLTCPLFASCVCVTRLTTSSPPSHRKKSR